MARKPILIPSLYNFHVHLDGQTLLYNAATGCVIGLQGDGAILVADFLETRTSQTRTSDLPTDVRTMLEDYGFLVEDSRDEVAEVRSRYWKARSETPMALTITTTLDCNLGCYYCYEERSASALASDDIAAIVDLARSRLMASNKKRLHVDWYGGEPMLNVEFIEAMSIALQTMCEREDIGYAASIISNGTCWPADCIDFVLRHKIRQVQISFDGLRENHNRRRRYRDSAKNTSSSSFDQAVTLVDSLLSVVRVDVRMNIDAKNASDAIPFIEFARDRGWFDRPFPAIIQPARLSAYSDASSFMRKSELSLESFDSIREEIRRFAADFAKVEEGEVPDKLPVPRSSVCAALADSSVVIGADRKYYRCGLQVSEPHRAVGTLPKRKGVVMDLVMVDDKNDALWWNEFDPTTRPTCAKCSFLPICWGGCPKKHLDGDTHALAEQGAYWRSNLPRLIAEAVGKKMANSIVLTEHDQFRIDNRMLEKQNV